MYDVGLYNPYVVLNYVYNNYYFHHAWHLLKYFRIVLVIEVRSMDEFFKELINRTKYFEQIEQFKDVERKSK